MKHFKILEEYIEAALQRARYEKIEKGALVYAEITGFQGVWADGETRAAAQSELRQVLRGWIELQLERGQKLPTLKGIQTPQLSFA